MTTYIPVKVSAPTGSLIVVQHAGSGRLNQQATLLKAQTQSYFAHAVGGYMQRTGSNTAKPQFGVWSKGTNGLPDILLAYTSAASIGPSGVYELPIVWTLLHGTTSPQVPLRLTAGTEVFIGVHNENAGLEMHQPLGAINAPIYQKATATGNPTSPFGTAPSQISNYLPAWLVVETGVAPSVTLTGPPAVVSSATPTLTATVSDPDFGAVGKYDTFRWYQIEVRQIGTTTPKWSFQTTTSTAEKAANAISLTYAGAALLEGLTYEWRMRAQDDILNTSAWSAWRSFLISGVGEIDVANASPTGKIESGHVASWIARWTHPGGLSANQVDIQILDDGVPARTLPTPLAITAVANNAFITVAAASVPTLTTASVPLPAGDWTWVMRARDTTGSWSPWSEPVAFSVNFPPNQPSNLDPPSGSQLVGRPLISWDVSDPDLDDVLGIGLESQVEIRRPDLSLNYYTLNGPTFVDSVTMRGFLQLTATHAPTTSGTYEWRVRGRDISANVYGPWSTVHVFTLQIAPLVTLNLPLQNATVATSSPTFTWSVVDGSMAFYTVRIYYGLEAQPFYSTGAVPVSPVATSGQYKVPANVLRNNTNYSYDVTIQTSGGISSTSARRSFRVQYPSADPLQNLQTSLISYPGDYESTSVSLSWGITAYSQGAFEGYVIWRRTSEQPQSEAVPIAHILNAGKTSFTDHSPPPNEPIIYSVTQMYRTTTGEVRSSEHVESDTTIVEVHVPVLVRVEQGETNRIPVMWLRDGVSDGFVHDEASVSTWGTGGVPTLIASPAGYGYKTKQIDFTIRTDQWSTVLEKKSRLENIVAIGGTFCLIEEHNRLFCRVVGKEGWMKRGKVAGTFLVSLSLEQTSSTDVVSVST